MDHCVLVLLCLTSIAALVCCHDNLPGGSEELSHAFLHHPHVMHGDDDTGDVWQMGKMADMMKMIKYNKFMKHDSDEEHRRVLAGPHSPGYFWKSAMRPRGDQQRSGLFRQLMGVVKNVQQKREIMDSHKDLHDRLDAVEHLKRSVGDFHKHDDMHDMMYAMKKHDNIHNIIDAVAAKRKLMDDVNVHENMHGFMEALEHKKKAIAAMHKHEEMHRFLDALSEKKKMIESMKKHEDFHDFVNMMTAQKKKMDVMKRHAQFHDYMDVTDDHKDHVQMMGKFNTMLAIHSQAHAERDFGDQMMGLMQRKRQFVFTIVYELMKFCKCRESIENLHKFFNPDEVHHIDMSGNNTSIMDIDDHIKYFHPRSVLQAKTMFMKGMVKTLCLTAKGYVQHVKALAAHHLAHHFLLGGMGTVSNSDGLGDNSGDRSAGDNTDRRNGNDGSQTQNSYSGSQTMNI